MAQRGHERVQQERHAPGEWMEGVIWVMEGWIGS
jgi:hypothetical protein